jgi:DNA helicase-4
MSTTTFSPGIWGRLFGGGSDWTLVLGAPHSEMTEASGQRRELATGTLEKARVEPRLLWATVTVDHEGQEIRLPGLTRRRAAELVQAAARKESEQKLSVERERKARLEGDRRREYEELLPYVKSLDAAIVALLGRNRYIRGHDVRWLLDSEAGNIARLPRFADLLNVWPFDAASYEKARKRVVELTRIIQPPHVGIDDWNKLFVKREMTDPRWVAFFKQVEKTELTFEQQEAVVVFEDRNLLIAAAGSGKSSTLVAKVGYAISRDYAKPHEVLALAFNAKAADEIRDRLADRLQLSIQAQTFHSLGKTIIEAVEGKRAPVEKLTRQLMQKLVTELQISDRQFLDNWLFFKAVYWESGPEQEFDSVEAYETYVRGKGRRHPEREQWGIPSLRGEPVKSFEELAIANWLYIHGVRYRYEAPFEHDVTGRGWTKYEPDFVYELADGRRLYHEHFALRKDHTSPFGEKYTKSVTAKRELHAECGTLLIETTSAQFRDGSVFAHLQRELTSHGVPFARKSVEELKDLLKERNDLDLVKLMHALMSHAKESGYGEDHFRTEADRQLNVARAHAFLQLLFPVWHAYDHRLHVVLGKIDFADMIGRATTYVRQGRYESPFRLVLVDEFQDISPGRAGLVKALLAKHPDSVLFGVGDDWQAINRFAGSDLSIMREFDAHFGKTETRRLSATFRSNQGISDVAAHFVRKNPAQISKEVRAKNPEAVGVVRIVEYPDKDALISCIERALAEIAALAESRTRVVTALILGRYQYETTKVITEQDIDRWNDQYRGRVEIKKVVDEKKKTVKPLDTVHKSKGLEADFVLVHSMQAKWYAFPSEMEDDPLLGLSFANREAFEYAEERRLFYVALTRAREQVTLFLSSTEPSRFVLELLQPEYGKAVAFEGKDEQPIRCNVCRQGYMVQRPGKRGPFYGCTRYPSLRCRNQMTLEQRARIR